MKKRSVNSPERGALDLTDPWHLWEKLDYEIDRLTDRPEDSYAAINALRDGYHLREWIWHGRLEADAALQTKVMGKSGDEASWNSWVNQCFPDFALIRELCNGSKHFSRDPANKVRGAHRAGYGSPLFAYGEGPLGYDVRGLFMELNDGRIVSVANLVDRIRDFWADKFEQFPELR